jgi:hypothetical protein
MPQADEREQLWDRAIPRKVPGRSDIDFRELAKRFDFTGGMPCFQELLLPMVTSSQVASLAWCIKLVQR